MVETNGQLVRACATGVSAGMEISTNQKRLGAAQRKRSTAFSPTTFSTAPCATNNNGNCTSQHGKMLGIEHQPIPFHSKPYERIIRILLPLRPATMHSLRPMRRSLPKRRQVNETLSIIGKILIPRALGWRSTIGESSCVSCATASRCARVTRSWKIHARPCGILTELPKTT